MIVTRGLGRGIGALLVTAGMGLSASSVPPTPSGPEHFYVGPVGRPRNIDIPRPLESTEEADLIAIVSAALQFMGVM